MNWQLALVSICVVAAALYVGRQTWRAWFGRKTGGCGGSCKCADSGAATEDVPPVALISDEELTSRLRRLQ